MLRVHFLNVGHGDCTIIRLITFVSVGRKPDTDASSKE
jgi:hypothetical protein